MLQWYNVYETCMACHDGTVTTTYNVEDGYIGNTTARTFGGKFGTGAEAYLSNHNVTGAVQISAAPGGSTVAVTGTTEYGKTVTQWATEFGCESCHSPHGQGGNARILHPDPNGVATARKPAGGFTYLGELGSITIDATTTGVVYETGVGYKVYFNGEPALLIKGYPYGVNVYDNGKVSWGAKVDNSNGYTVITGVDLSGVGDRVYGTPAIQVKMIISNYLEATESVTHISGLNTFCGACHTDYNTENVYKDTTDTEPNGSGEMLNGTYSEAYRHQVGFNWHGSEPGLDFEENNRVTCLTCHVAHGVDQDYWNATVGPGTSSDIALENLKEIAGSSALKRKPNMGVCETCHKKGDGNEGYAANTGMSVTTTATTQNGLYAQKSTLAFNNYVGWKECAKCHEEQAAPYKEQHETDVFKVYVKWTSGAWPDASSIVMAYDQDAFDRWVNRVKHTQKIMPVETGTPTESELLAAGVDAADIGTVDANGNATEWTYFTNFRPEALQNWATSSFADPSIDGRTGSAITPDNVLYTLGVKWKQRYVFQDSLLESNGWSSDGVDDGLRVGSGNAVMWTTGYAGTTAGWAAYKAITDDKDWDVGCGSCHATGINIDAVNTAYDPTIEDQYFRDTGITCEACHGPGANHVKYPTPENIINPAKLSLAQKLDVCGQCHIRGSNRNYAGRSDAYGFVPGQDQLLIVANYQPITFTKASYTVFDKDGNPVVVSDLKVESDASGDGSYSKHLWANNFSKGHHQQYIDFIQSEHYAAQIMDCATCHSAHDQYTDGIQLKFTAESICASCHDTFVDVDAYMPRIAKSANKWDIRSHAFSSIYDLNNDGDTDDTVDGAQESNPGPIE
ncbi:cytochrome c [Calderihabitans maritimus]|uniref:Cytochrome c n=1 Tax=Calderihabitans maritimus TaxID=1246530 RepID=A0A1Z5HUT7_9FIRM|nr:cytochrome c [Calderihabitans maritimus]